MSKPITLSSIMSALFPGSDKVISEKLSTDEHAAFGAEVQELNDKITAHEATIATTAAELVTAGEALTTATASVATLTAQLATANGQITTLTTERDKYKAHHDKISSKGDSNPDTDENSKGKNMEAGYNQHALNVWQKANRS
jgi:chromosome segregation ATPase